MFRVFVLFFLTNITNKIETRVERKVGGKESERERKAKVREGKKNEKGER